MKIKVSCMQCFSNGQEQDKDKTLPYIPSYPYWEYPTIELDKWPYLEFTCEKGHLTRLTLSFELYELLFQQATYCIMDGYYRESISTYNAALERFIEYMIEMMMLSNSMNLDFNKLWKEVSNQSERQLGAFYFLYSIHFNELPPFLDQNKVVLRNQVVHKGKLATKDEALGFGKYVFDYIKNTLHKLEGKHSDTLGELRAMRHFRLIKLDFEKAMKNPIQIVIDGEEQYLGNTNMAGPCFLTQESIKNYEDCFKEENQLSYGLQR